MSMMSWINLFAMVFDPTETTYEIDALAKSCQIFFFFHAKSKGSVISLHKSLQLPKIQSQSRGREQDVEEEPEEVVHVSGMTEW